MKFKKLIFILSSLAICAAVLPAIPVSAAKAETEWNDNRSHADVIAFEDMVFGEIDRDGDQDVYRFEPAEDVTGSVELWDAPNDKRWFLWVMDADWKPLAKSIDIEAGFQSLTYDFKAGETYYIVVCPWEKIEDNFGGSYTLYLVQEHEYTAYTDIDAVALDPSLRHYVESSDLIATVIAKDSHIENIKGNVYTVTELQITHVIKGDYDANTVDVKLMGGGVKDNTFYVTPSGYHHFVEGRNYLVFLKLYDDAPASSLTLGAGYILGGKVLEYRTLDNKSAGFNENMITEAEYDYIIVPPYLEAYHRVTTDKTYENGEYIGEVAYDGDSMTPDASLDCIISNFLPVGTKLYFAKGAGNTIIIAEVDGGQKVVFYSQFDE